MSLNKEELFGDLKILFMAFWGQAFSAIFASFITTAIFFTYDVCINSVCPLENTLVVVSMGLLAGVWGAFLGPFIALPILIFCWIFCSVAYKYKKSSFTVWTTIPLLLSFFYVMALSSPFENFYGLNLRVMIPVTAFLMGIIMWLLVYKIPLLWHKIIK